jgi:hypothetical protein
MKYPTIYAKLKTFLAKQCHLNRRRIKAKLELRKHPLYYDEPGMRALAGKLNRVFQDPPLKTPLTQSKTATAKTIRDLANLIREGYE